MKKKIFIFFISITLILSMLLLITLFVGSFGTGNDGDFFNL